jgi:hypothetical protein
VPPQVFAPGGTPLAGRLTPASFPFYTTGEDNLRLTVWTAQIGLLIGLQARVIDARNSPVPYSGTLGLTAGNRQAETTEFALSGTTLLNVTVFVQSGGTPYGQTFVKLDLIRGLGAGALVLGTILQGYITTTQARGWPGSPIESSLDGGGYSSIIFPGGVPVGGNVVITVPTGARWVIQQAIATLVTDAVVGNRNVQLAIVQLGKLKGLSVCKDFQPASTSVLYAFGDNLLDIIRADGGAHCLPWVSEIYAVAGDNVLIQGINLDANDGFANPALTVREWLEP